MKPSWLQQTTLSYAEESKRQRARVEKLKTDERVLGALGSMAGMEGRVFTRYDSENDHRLGVMAVTGTFEHTVAGEIQQGQLVVQVDDAHRTLGDEAATTIAGSLAQFKELHPIDADGTIWDRDSLAA